MEDRTMSRRQVLPALAAGAATGAFLTSSSVQAAERHPHIRQAIRELKEARVELKEGEKIFGGHREKALRAVDEAIEQLEKALEFASK